MGEVKLSDDQFWALERWIISVAGRAATPFGFCDHARADSIRDTAYVALTGKSTPSAGPSAGGKAEGE